VWSLLLLLGTEVGSGEGIPTALILKRVISGLSVTLCCLSAAGRTEQSCRAFSITEINAITASVVIPLAPVWKHREDFELLARVSTLFTSLEIQGCA